MSVRFAVAAFAWLLPLCFAAVAAAETSTTAMVIPPGFEPVPGGKPAADEANASLLVLAAYAAFALGFVGYLLHLVRTQARIGKQIEELGARLDARREP